MIAKDLALYFKDINKNFDRERFLSACGVENSCKKYDKFYLECNCNNCK